MPRALITFEGPEGSGKSTQAELLAQTLANLDIKIKLTREPGGDPVSEQIRKILLDGEDHSVTDRTELLLYEAARSQHIERVILPHLNDDYIVICGRFTDSTVAYQGYGGGIDVDAIERLNTFATSGIEPDITFLFDIDVETGLRRQNDWNRMERKAVEYHQRVRQGFLAQAERYPNRIVVISALQSIEEIHEQVMQIVAERLKIRV